MACVGCWDEGLEAEEDKVLVVPIAPNGDGKNWDADVCPSDVCGL